MSLSNLTASLYSFDNRILCHKKMQRFFSTLHSQLISIV